MRLWIDADACPVAIRDILVKAATKRQIQAVFFANHWLRLPPSPWVSLKVVASGFDVADSEILGVAEPQDLVISQDVPLAAELVARAVTVINPRGTLYTEETMHSHLVRRNQAQAARDLGIQGRGQAPLSARDIQAFAQTLDRMLTRLARPS